MAQYMKSRFRWLFCILFLCINLIEAINYASLSRKQVDELLEEVRKSKNDVLLEEVARSIINENKEALVPSKYRSVYYYLGLANFRLGGWEQATEMFLQAIKMDENDIKSLVYYGACHLYQNKFAEAEKIYEQAVIMKGSEEDTHHLFKARNWMAKWKDRDEMLSNIEAVVQKDILNNNGPRGPPIDFAELGPKITKALSEQTFAGAIEPAPLSRCTKDDFRLRTPKLKLGFISSDFKHHPVMQLLRGLLSYVNKDKFVVYCFALTPSDSWWSKNVSGSVDYMIPLEGKDSGKYSEIIKSHGIHVLVDLNGHTSGSGLGDLIRRPAPVQMSFLGYPMTSGGYFIDYYLTDPIATTPFEAIEAFTEKQLYLSTHYIVNDYAQIQGHTIDGERPILPPLMDSVTDRPFVFATFSNWQKMDPSIFMVWMQILSRVSNSVLWFLRYDGHEEAEKSLRAEANAHGIEETRLVFTDLAPWGNHTYYKRAADLILDTSLKNGHTTLIDGLWAGVPTITLEGSRMSNRAGSSALESIGFQDLTVNSYKEYAEVAVKLATDEHLLREIRQKFESNRLTYPLFDTKKYTVQFERLMLSSWDVSKKRCFQEPVGHKPLHIFLPRRRKIELTNLQVYSVFQSLQVVDEYESTVNHAIKENQEIRLHIGGYADDPAWWIVDISQSEHTDFVLDMQKLYCFPDKSVTAIYASHVLEHTHYGVDGEVDKTLKEWHRVLKPDGKLYVAVPDIYVLSSLMVDKSLTEQDRYFVMAMMYGGQVDIYDVHKVGFTEGILAAFLKNAGFCDFIRVGDFGLFQDSSVMEYKGRKISLNIIATPCEEK